jgi:hypothetical protein
MQGIDRIKVAIINNKRGEMLEIKDQKSGINDEETNNICFNL